MQNQKPIAAYIVFVNHPTLKEKIPLLEGQNLIGRVPEKASVVIKDAQISSIHAKVKITSNKITIIDMGSKNGTFLDVDVKDRIQKEKEYEIHEGQTLAFGQVQFIIERVPQPKKAHAQTKNQKSDPEKKLNIFAEFEQLTQKESKKAKANRNQQDEASIDSSIAQKKLKKGTEKDQKEKKEAQKVRISQEQSEIESSIDVPVKKSKEEDDKKSKATKEKQAKQREEKQKKQKKQKELKEKKLKQEKEKKQKEEKIKRELQQKRERQKQEKQRQQEKERDEQKRREKQEKAQAKKKQELENKKKAAEGKKDNPKKPSKNRNSEEDDSNKLNPKDIKGRYTKSLSKEKNDKQKSKSKSKQKSEVSEATSRNKSQSSEKESSPDKNKKKLKESKGSKKGKGSKEAKDKIEKKGQKASFKLEKKEKDKSSSKQKSDKQSVSKEKKEKIVNKANSRKRVPAESESNENEQDKRYPLRRRLLKVTKFKISGNPIKFMTSPFLKLADDDDEEFDVLVMDGFIRTYKILFAISKGIPVVKKSWLSESEYIKKQADVNFHWLEYPGDKWLIKESVTKVQEGEMIFKGMEFYIASSNENLHIEQRKLERLIYNCGGSVILFSTKMKADKNYSKKVFVLLERDYEEDELNRAKAVNKDNIYDVELVLESILTQNIDFKKHKMNV